MSDYLKQMVDPINNASGWSLLEKLYNNFFEKEDKKEQRIPKIIHQIWLGGSYPERYSLLRDKMMNINKDFEYKLWMESDVQQFGLKNEKLYNNIRNLGAKSDIFRYEILERYGGIYIDTDFDCIKPFSDLLSLDFFAGNCAVPNPEVFNSLMAASPNYKYIKLLVEELQKIEIFHDDINGVMNNTGPYFISRVFFKNMNETDNVVIFPTKFFFAFPAIYRHNVDNSEESRKFIYSFKNENTYCLHLWHTTWQK